MKLIGNAIVLILIMVIVLPLFIVKGCDVSQNDLRKEKPNQIQAGEIVVSVFNHRNNEVMELDIEEYVMGVVAAEMPVSFDIEALKAQAVAARTYTIKRLQEFGASPNPNHPQYDMCTDHNHCQAWISKEERIKAWENDENIKIGLFGSYEDLWDKIEEAVIETRGEAVTYNDKLIDPLFHSTSGGKTENSEDYFVASVPYLRSVASQYEEESPHLKSQKVMSIDGFVEGLKGKIPDIEIDKKNIKNEIKVLEKTQGDQIKEIQIGNKVLSGREVREALGLKSAGFSINITTNEIEFTTTGYGHGVGMSQYGADGMAKAGKDYKEIIQHYYQGVEIINIHR